MLSKKERFKRRPKWARVFTQKEWTHLCRGDEMADGKILFSRPTRLGLMKLIEAQEEFREKDRRDPLLEPCWICRGIGRKLGLLGSKELRKA